MVVNFFLMAKLDLSALKKQKITSVNPVGDAPALASLSLSSEAELVMAEAPIGVPIVLVEPELIKTEEAAPRAKLSLSSFKKPSTVITPAVAPVMAPVVADTPIATPATAIIATPVTVAHAIAIEEELIAPDSLAVTPSVSLPIFGEDAPDAPAVEVVMAEAFPHIVEEAPLVVENTEVKTKVSNSEFFPNLEFENDNLFNDIVEMGSF